jgi:predicted nucleic acid-binding protein
MLSEKLYDTSAVIDLILHKNYKVVPGTIPIITIIEWPPALNYVHRILYPTKNDYAKAVELQMKLRKKGEPLPATDLIIAAMAVNNNMILITLDKHFQVIREVESKLQLEMTIK